MIIQANLKLWCLVSSFCFLLGCVPHQLGDVECQLFYDAAREQNVAALESLIKRVGDVDMIDSKGRTLLYLSSLNGYLGFVETLLSKGADPLHQVSWKDDQTALHASASQGHVEIMKLLLKTGMDVDIETRHGVTPLILAARNARPDAVVCLVAQRADVSHKDSNKKTVLHDMIDSQRQGDFTETLKVLLDAGADVNAKSALGETPLMQMCQLNNLEGVQILLERGANPTTQNKYGVTVLQYADNNLEIKIIINEALNSQRVGIGVIQKAPYKTGGE